jgi:hypothetical protein
MADEKFKLPLSSYEELAKIIKTYGQISKPESLTEISTLSGMNTTVISRNAGFLTAIGVLESGAKKSPTPPGRELAQALEHNMKDEITNCWRKIVSGNDFFEKLLTAIRIRNGMDEDTLEKHIAYSAGQPKKRQFMTGARTVVDILRAAGQIIESDGKIITKVGVVPAEGVNIIESMKRPEEKPAEAIQPKAKFAVPGVEVRLNIQVNIDCTPADLGELTGKLKTLIKEFSLDNGGDDESA